MLNSHYSSQSLIPVELPSLFYFYLPAYQVLLKDLVSYLYRKRQKTCLYFLLLIYQIICGLVAMQGFIKSQQKAGNMIK